MDNHGAIKYPNISRMSNDELRRYGIENLILMLRQVDSDRIDSLREHGNLMKDVNKRMQTHLMEIRSLKEVNKKLQDENQEVRDLACFLDDDRQKGRKLAREWQRFGRYTSGVMKGELAAYQMKLKELEDKQELLMKENIELKELCIFLDEELKRGNRGDSIDRDEGDGSSSSSPTGEKADDPATYAHYNTVQQPLNAVSEQTLQYIRQLEHQIEQLEQDRKHQEERARQNSSKYFPTSRSQETLDGRPASVDQAMQVLEIQERLEHDLQRSDQEMILDDAEKAIVRQMCSVVWKKLGDS